MSWVPLLAIIWVPLALGGSLVVGHVLRQAETLDRQGGPRVSEHPPVPARR